jgi:hypothetical protein
MELEWLDGDLCSGKYACQGRACCNHLWLASRRHGVTVHTAGNALVLCHCTRGTKGRKRLGVIDALLLCAESENGCATFAVGFRKECFEIQVFCL